MESVKLFQVNIFMPVAKFPHLAIWLFCKRKPFGSLVSSGSFPKKLTAKIGDFALIRERERKNANA